MDYQEFDQHAADYAEGALDNELRSLMDSARAMDPACDQLARLHERILAVLVETREVEAPAGLAERIIAEAEFRDQLLAAEQRAFRRGMWLGVAGAAVGAAALAMFLFIFDLSTGAGTLDAVKNVGNKWMAQVWYTLSGWFGSAGTFMKSEIALPVIGSSMPVYVLILSALITVLLAWFREEIREAVYF